jgi:hypothetical protein
MNSALIGLIATIVGAIIGTFLNEMYKRHRDAVATAAALAGELASYRLAFFILDQSMPVLIQRVERGEPLNLPAVEQPTDVVFAAYVDKLGLLGHQLAEQAALVYGQIRGFRAAFFALTRADMKFDTPYLLASLKAAHSLAQAADGHGQPLVAALQERANQSFCQWCRFWKKKAR